MANPQPDQYLKLSNELSEAMCRAPWLPYHVRCFVFIMRQTYGFNRTWAEIRNRDFVKATGINKANICRAIRQLVGANAVVVQSDNKKAPSYRIQKDYDLWGSLPARRKPLSNRTTTVVQSGNKTLSNQATPIYNKDKKDNLKTPAELSADPPPDPSGQEKKPTPKTKKKRAKTIATGWPKDFGISNGMAEFAIEHGYDPAKLDQLMQAWHDQCDAKGYKYKNWRSAYRNMIRADWKAHKIYKSPAKAPRPWEKYGKETPQ